MRKGFFMSLLLMIFISSDSLAQDWNAWLDELRAEALEDGIQPAVFDLAFQDVKPSQKVMFFDRTQPEKRITFLEYRQSRIDAFRIRLGRIEYKKHRDLLEKIGAEYHVSPCFITAFWGIESSYGRFKGDFPVISSLATLAYEGRRKAFFRNELLLGLHIVNGNHVSLKDFKGEWAGASGHTQFLPSSWHKYAVDYDSDGHRNIWNSLPDVFASIANYLKMNDWHYGEPWAVEASLPPEFDQRLLGAGNTRTVSEWMQMGVKIQEKVPQNLEAALIMPNGGPVFMIFHNFNVIKTYNNSTYYAGSVGYLADHICAGI